MTFFTLSPVTAIPANTFQNPVFQGFTVPVKAQQGFRVVSFDLQIFNADAVFDDSLILRSFGAEMDTPSATIRTWPSGATMGLPLGIVNCHIAELDLTYWNDWSAQGGVAGQVFLIPDVSIKNTDGVNPHHVQLETAAIVEIYDFSLG